MKIKTIKLKVENDNQEFDFNQFLEGNNTIYNLHAQLLQEGKHKYWHVLFTYSPTIVHSFLNTPKQSPPIGFENEIRAYMEKNTLKTKAIVNTLKANITDLGSVKELSDFGKFRNFGAKKIKDNEAYLKAIIKIIKKHY